VKNAITALLFAALIATASGCATAARQPECRGPWTPINASRQVHANG
jgi:Flp pilus assembly protein TadD